MSKTGVIDLTSDEARAQIAIDVLEDLRRRIDERACRAIDALPDTHWGDRAADRIEERANEEDDAVCWVIALLREHFIGGDGDDGADSE